MTIKVGIEYVIEHNFFSKKMNTESLNIQLEKAQLEIDGKLGDNYVYTTSALKAFYKSCIAMQTYVFMLSAGMDILFAEGVGQRLDESVGVRYMNPSEREAKKAELQTEINLYIAKLIDEMEDSDIDPEQPDGVINEAGMVGAFVGGNPNYKPKYINEVIDEY